MNPKIEKQSRAFTVAWFKTNILNAKNGIKRIDKMEEGLESPFYLNLRKEYHKGCGELARKLLARIQ